MFLRSARHMAMPGISTNDRDVVRAGEKLTAFLELEAVIRACRDRAPTSISAQKFLLCRQEDVCIQFGDQTHVRFS
jgi:hypothetical protein